MQVNMKVLVVGRVNVMDISKEVGRFELVRYNLKFQEQVMEISLLHYLNITK